MQLVAFSVRNYRSITTAYRLPVKQSTVLIGPNNEGKSNVLRALVTSLKLLQSLGSVRITAGRLLPGVNVASGSIYKWLDDFPVSLQQSAPQGESIFDLQFRLNSAEVDEFYAEVGSNLNGNLPIRLTLGVKSPGFRVMKKGPGGPALSKKSERIANFVSKRININYIPAIRTAEAAQEIVGQMVDAALKQVETDQAYQDALAEVAKIQQPLLDKISEGIKDTLKVFLPGVKAVQIGSQAARYRALRRVDVLVDDGTLTDLVRKGDGVQSLAALSLMRQASVTAGVPQQLILAIEEPESHLHPSAIHQLKAVLAEIAQTSQVIMTTHCPLFVERTSISSNIIVHGSKAVAAKSIVDIRNILGVRASDNLQHAELILIVEGEDDRLVIRALLSQASTTLAGALKQGSLAIESLQGASNLSYKVSSLREALCNTHVLLDWDAAGLQASAKAVAEGLLTAADVHHTIVAGQKEAEMEDMFDVSIYAAMLQTKFGVSTQSPQFKGPKKWSERLHATFLHQGKIWNSGVQMAVKASVADLVAATPAGALNIHKKGVFDALVRALEGKLQTIQAGKLSP
jgi:putative ATP-dependent endonuclease of OLD family